MQNLLDYLSRVRPILEAIYFITSIGIVIGVWVAVRQLRVTKNIADTNVKREAAKLAADQCRYLADTVIPAFETLGKKYKSAGLTFLGKARQANQPLIQITNGEFVNPNHDPEALQKEWVSIAPELVVFLNNLEYFSMPFTAGVADEEVAFPVAARPFITGVNLCIVGLYHLRATGAGRYESTLKLHTVWFTRLVGAAAATAVPQMQEMIKNAANNKIDVIGGPDKGTVRKLYARLWLKLKPKDLKA